MQYELAAAAHAAAARAAACRLRGSELADRCRIGAEDVRRAQVALAEAMQRAAAAQRRLAELRLQRRLGPHPDLIRQREACGPLVDAANVRQHAGGLARDTLFFAYLALGGRCDEVEVDAFLHAVFELPSDEVSVLAHAVWELTEL